MVNVPGTRDEWYDDSAITIPEVVDTAVRPLFLTAFPSDRGPVGYRRIHGEDFYKVYGRDCDFKKYGQGLLQAAQLINAGAELLCTRVVAEDAALANLTITATVKAVQTQKTNAAGELLYIDKVTSAETTDATSTDGQPNEAAKINTATIKYDAVTMDNVKSYDDIKTSLAGLVKEDVGTSTFTYPIFTVVDTGIGASTKRFRISPNYTVSRSIGYVIYQFIYAGTQGFDYEYKNFSTVPGQQYNQGSMSLRTVTAGMLQIKGYEYIDGIDKLYDKISEITGITVSELYTYDIINGTDVKGKALSAIDIDSTGYDLKAEIGLALQSGSNGSFGDSPINAESYSTQLIKAFDGTLSNEIYDLDRYQIDACVDANYPVPVKNKIVELADFRKDFFFFGDLGIGADNYDLVASAYAKVKHSKFAAYTFQTGQIIDPFSKRYITVTLNHEMAPLLVDHILNKPHCPFCGILHGFRFPNIVEGSVNWLPIKTPTVDQKNMLMELGVNYASILTEVLTLETEYTSQEDYTQLSFINNVTAIQQIIKDIRYHCPQFRYSFATTDDLDDYKTQVDNIIKKYSSNFEILEFTYVQDEIMKANKVFEASIRVKHKTWYQSELFKIYTLAADYTTAQQ